MVPCAPQELNISSQTETETSAVDAEADRRFALQSGLRGR